MTELDESSTHRVLVTGAAGFIGSHLVDRLLDAGHTVIGLDRRASRPGTPAHFGLSRARTRREFSLVEDDLSRADLDRILDGVGCVYHLAAVPGVHASWGTGFTDYVQTNVCATQRLVAACERAGVARLVYASSSSVYGPAVNPSRACDPTHPISPYGVTKLAGEQLCLAYARKPGSGLRVAALRYFTVYGPRQRPDMAISRLLAAALTGARYTLFGDGTQRREFTYVSDVVDATLAASRIEAGAAIVNVGGGTSVSLIELLGVVRDLTGSPVSLTAVAARAGDVAATAADLSTARALLGYEPRVDLRTGMRRHVRWLRQLPPDVLRTFVPSPEPGDVQVPACMS